MRNFYPRQPILIVCNIAITIIAFFVTLPVFAEPYDPQLGSKIDNYLAGFGSPIVGNGAVFFSSGAQWDVDPRLIVAIAGAESSFGTVWVNCPQSGFNAWSWFWHSSDHTCPTSPFNSFADGINTVTKFMRLSYFNNGQTTIPTIKSTRGHQYCVSNCSGWIANVTSFYTAQDGDPSDLTFHIGLIDFEQFTGASSVFTGAQPPLQVFAEINGTVSTKISDSATISGGEVLNAATNAPADRSVIYGTAFFCSGCLPAITIQFANKVSNFSVFLLNGQAMTLTYMVEDDQGGMQTKTLGANLDSGSGTVMLLRPVYGK